MGENITESDIYLAIPLQRGQLSTRELMLGKFGHTMLLPCTKDSPLTVDHIDTPYAQNENLRRQIFSRGL